MSKIKSSPVSYEKPEKQTSKLEKILLIVILIGALFVRWYRLDNLLGFHYDQGRDALKIREFITQGKPFLVGPVTGLDGIYLGPLFYYLLAPFYWIGYGNPVIPTMFLGALQLVTILLLYRLGKSVNTFAGLLAAFIYSFSQPLFWLNRWLSNPVPLLPCSMILMWSLFQITKGKTKHWITTSLAISASLQFEAASAIFFLPAVFIFLIWQWKYKPNKRQLFIAILVFVLSLIPQIVFDFRHEHLLFRNFKKELIAEKSFSGSPAKVFNKRILFYRDAFGSKIFAYDEKLIAIGMPLVLLLMVITFKKWRSSLATTSLILLLTPLTILFIFQGNHGNFYDYYLIGNFPIFILLLSICLGSIVKYHLGRLAAILIIFLFIKSNYLIAYHSLTAGVDGPEHISLGNQKQAINWIYENADKQEFNIDVYVPPVIPKAYEYLFAWMGDNLKKHPKEDLVPLLYTLYEVDPPHPERLEAWLIRQKGIGKVMETQRFGGITVEKRMRIDSK